MVHPDPLCPPVWRFPVSAVHRSGIQMALFKKCATHAGKKRKPCTTAPEVAMSLLWSSSAAPHSDPVSGALFRLSYLCRYGDALSDAGRKKLEAMLTELERAERYIFMEYFIVQEGVMWDSILRILKRKAAQGVKVRLLYDDMGCFLTLPKDYPKQLKGTGSNALCSIPSVPF